MYRDLKIFTLEEQYNFVNFSQYDIIEVITLCDVLLRRWIVWEKAYAAPVET